MQEGKKIYFASDFHLGVPSFEKSREREKILVDWLDKIKEDAQEIYLVGDLFDFWFEYKHVAPKGYIRFLGKIADIVSATTGKNLPVSSIRVKKFTSSTEFKSAKGTLDQFIAPFELHEGIEQTLQSEFISPNPHQEIFYTE